MGRTRLPAGVVELEDDKADGVVAPDALRLVVTLLPPRRINIPRTKFQGGKPKIFFIQLDRVQAEQMQVDLLQVMEKTNRQIWEIIGNVENLNVEGAFERFGRIREQSLSIFQNVPKCMLTTLHKSYVALLLHFGKYEEIFSDIVLPIVSVHTSSTDSDILLFYYYLGLAQIKTERFMDARISMLSVLAIPASEFSVISLAACRKLCLLDLMIFGKMIPLPEWIVNRNHPVCIIWEDIRKRNRPSITIDKSDADESSDPTAPIFPLLGEIVNLYTSSNDSKDLSELIQSHRDTLVDSRDFGLAQRVVVSKRSQALTALEKTHSVIPLVEVIGLLKLDDKDQIHILISAYNLNSSTIATVDGDYLSFACVSNVPSEEKEMGIIHSLMNSLQSKDPEELKSIKTAKLKV